MAAARGLLAGHNSLCMSPLSDACFPSTSGRFAPVRGDRLRSRSMMMPMHATDPVRLPKAPGGVIPGARTPATPRLTPERVMQRLAEMVSADEARYFGAFFSSELGGIVTEPGFALLPAEDAMALHGDAVTEGVRLVDGQLYQMDRHLERFAHSAQMAGLHMPLPEARLRRVLLDTAAASLKMNGMLHFWLSRGRVSDTPGGAGGGPPALYALLSTRTAYDTHIDRDAGWRAVTSPVEAPSPYLALCRSSSRGAGDALCALEAAGRDAELGVYVDADETVLGGPGCSVLLLTRDGTLVVPPQDSGLAGMAARNVAELAPQYALEEGDVVPVQRVERRIFSLSELRDAAEAFAVSSTIGVVGISHIDGHWIGAHEFEGAAGPTSLALNEMLIVARKPTPGSSEHTEVPYGYMTGMLSQLI